ncbi:BTAD domain-containing putative transcriptional regulator [Phytomonospora sp. NPDC050363]|uniref:AfsR/SARP family transcriptional regulator n=1 Tax=Phytomonospora sp. NPDC050363 TaxID=3155642 RepID=UPI0033DC6184
MHFPGRKRATLLAALLLDNRRVVPTERLISALWDEEPPATAWQQAQNLASGLRRDFATFGEPDLLDGVAGGYRIVAEPGRLDADSADSCAARARADAVAGRHSQAVAGFERALSAWRGPVLAGLRGRVIEAAALRLEESRLSLMEECEESRLAVGHHDEVIATTRSLLVEQPFRQRTLASLMRALDHAGRTAEALEVYAGFRARLSAELGIEPGADLKAVHLAILRPDPAPAAASPSAARSSAPHPPATSRTPAELPATVSGFVGRTRELAALTALDGRLATISGQPGVGKTALAVHWGNANRHRFPDGQLYVDLRGHGPRTPATPIEVLRRFLRTLGVTGNLPEDPEEAAAAYRSQVADRALLVVLDNVATAHQVRPLLPGGQRGFALVTSRDNLCGLIARDGARPVRLRQLDEHDSRALLTSALGTGLATGEPAALDRLAALCGHLPLALRIAAANVLADDHPSVAAYVERLDTDRLSALTVAGEPATAVSEALRMSYDALGDTERTLLRRLGNVAGPAFGTALADALLGADAGPALRRLVGQNLVEQPTAGCYRLHDLVRDYAEQRASFDESPSEHEAAAALAAFRARRGQLTATRPAETVTLA